MKNNSIEEVLMTEQEYYLYQQNPQEREKYRQRYKCCNNCWNSCYDNFFVKCQVHEYVLPMPDKRSCKDWM